MKMIRQIGVTLALAAFVGGLMLLVLTRKQARAYSPQEVKSLTIGHFKDEPVEVVSVKLRGKSLSLAVGGDVFAPTEDWTEHLEIAIKNVTEQPVSYVRVDLLTLAPAGSKDSISNSEFTFGNHPDSGDAPVFLQPDQTATLVHRGTHGTPADPRPAQILIQDVFWNNDNKVMWNAGKLVYRVSEKEPIYKRKSSSGAKYTFPKGYVPSAQLVKARAAPTPVTEFCDANYESTGPLDCTTGCPGGPKCTTTTVTIVPNGCNPLLGTGCDIRVETNAGTCTHSFCGAYCSGTTQARQSQVVCQPLESPIIVDVLSDGYSLTDKAAGVFFDITSSGSARLVSWTAPGADDSFLSLNRNGNGLIDDGRELFGNSTPQPASGHLTGSWLWPSTINKRTAATAMESSTGGTPFLPACGYGVT